MSFLAKRGSLLGNEEPDFQQMLDLGFFETSKV
jgi:hypothetical protein